MMRENRTALLAATAAAMMAILVLRPVAEREALASERYEDIYYIPPPAWLVLTSLGHREALADLIWCRALVYQGDEFAHSGTVTHVFRYADAMTSLDPDFRAVYLWIGTAGVYQPGQITADEVRQAITFLEAGRRRFPDDGELAWSLGATLAFELPPLVPEAERADARLRGVEHMMEAVRLHAAPEWIVLSNSTQLARLGRAERAAEHLEEMYATTSDDAVRTRIAQRIVEIRADAEGAAFVEANDELDRRNFREMPYLSPHLFYLLAEPDDESWVAAFRDGYGRSLLGEFPVGADDE